MAVSINILALQTNEILSIARVDDGKPNTEGRSRWKEPNEILFLRVRQIYDHVFEDIWESWFDRKRLFRVSNAYPVRRAGARGRVSLNEPPDRELEGEMGGVHMGDSEPLKDIERLCGL